MASKPPQKSATAAKSAATTRGLGRGLSTLLGDSGIATAANQAAPSDKRVYQQIPVEWINVGPWQPRRQFDREQLDELAGSIRQKGIVQPILLRPSPSQPGRYQLVAGERRWRAAQIAQLHQIPSVIRDLSDAECYEIALIENIQRQDLSVIDEAQGYANLLEINRYTQDQLSKIIGKSRSHIANLLRLLGLPESVQSMLHDGALTMGQARPLIGHPQAEFLAKTIVAKGLSARQAEALTKTAVSGATSAAKQSATTEKSADIKAIEQRAAVELGLAMSIKWNEQAETGRVQIDCQSLEQMTLILDKLGLSDQR
ncbi:MAG: ParB/RepB/Spo0J family partition protein [Proteobacteria bacterium]|nr:ParB/RepB/Spo0J family partition protein [Pseudomonadota bacterium]MDA0845741.1 ParB/RepB/Spo0J family partition protein [Pseudomonadota bacterium]